MQNPNNVLRHELIGLKTKVVKSVRPTDQGIYGEIVDETKNTIKIKADGKTKTLPKQGLVLEISLPEKTIAEIEGHLLAARPQDRVKNKQRIKFI